MHKTSNLSMKQYLSRSFFLTPFSHFDFRFQILYFLKKKKKGGGREIK